MLRKMQHVSERPLMGGKPVCAGSDPAAARSLDSVSSFVDTIRA